MITVPPCITTVVLVHVKGNDIRRVELNSMEEGFSMHLGDNCFSSLFVLCQFDYLGYRKLMIGY